MNYDLYSRLRTAIYTSILFVTFTLNAQTNTPVYRLDFEFNDEVPVIVNGDTLTLAWAGGIDQGQFVEMDLNLDGQMDILGFDRNGNRYIPLIKEGAPGNYFYRYDHNVIKHLPKAENYIQTADFNCDGKRDIMTVGEVGSTTVMIYENVSTATELRFQKAVSGPYITYTNNNNQQSSIYVSGTDIPVFKDINGDGSVDILSFNLLGVIITEYVNKNPCGLDFEIGDICYGKFMESIMGNNLDLLSCNYDTSSNNGNVMGEDDIEAVQHAESTMLSLDLNGDGLMDIILGDSDYPTLIAAFNGGTQQVAVMTSKDTVFPSYDVPAHMPNFPASFYIDVDHDDVRDLIVTSNSLLNGLSDTSVHFYKNTGLDSFPVFELQNRRLFQEDMIEMGTGAFPVLADFNGDGLPDLLVGTIGYRQDTMYNWNGQLFYYENTGTASQPEFTLTDNDFGNMSQYKMSYLYPTVYDLDDDGDLDILLGEKNGTLIYLENAGSATNPQFATPVFNYQNIDVGIQSAPALYDVSGNGKPELFIGEYDGYIAYYENTGTASNPDFQLVNSQFSGIRARGMYDAEGNAMPTFYTTPEGEIQLIVGSYGQGIQVYDSIEGVLSLPPSTSLTFGTGTIDLNTAELSVFGASRRTGRNQFIVKASELHNEGVYSGRIDAMSFEVTSSANPNLTQGFKISMKNIKNKDFSNGWIDPEITVFSGTWVLSLGWNQIPFITNTFEWDGESDILVEVCYSRNSNNHKNIDIKGTSLSEPLHAFGNNDNASGYNTLLADGCDMPFKNTTLTRPNVRFNVIPAVRKSNQFLKNGWRNAVALYDFDGDSLPEAILGNASGGLQFFKGILVEVEETNDTTSSVAQFNQVAEKALRLFPNPAENYFEIEFKDAGMHGSKIRQINMFNLSGKQIAQWNDVQHRQKLELPNLASGMYFVRIQTENEKWESHRLMIMQR
jgi:hypothetical protein